MSDIIFVRRPCGVKKIEKSLHNIIPNIRTYIFRMSGTNFDAYTLNIITLR